MLTTENKTSILIIESETKLSDDHLEIVSMRAKVAADALNATFIILDCGVTARLQTTG